MSRVGGGQSSKIGVLSSVLPIGAATAANQQTDALTDTELRATPVPISGSVVADLGANNDVTVTSGAITETNSGAIKTAVETIDNAISGTEMQVDVITMPTTTVEATNLDIRDLSETADGVGVYGSDDGGTTMRLIKTDAGGAIQVDLEVASVEVTSSALPTGASTSAKQDDIITAIGGVLPTSGNNPSHAFTVTNGQITKITKTINGTSYEADITWTSGVITNISSWSEI